MRFAAIVLAAVLAPAVVAGEPERFFFEHPAPDGSGVRRYEARIDRPDAGANGHAVMLVGGGSVTTMDWLVPGSYEHEGRTVAVTIDGEPTRDGATIGDALVRAGFVVMRWSSVHADDELARENPAMAMGIPFPESVGLTRAARDAFRERAPEARDRLILVGHSLGAPRASAVADEGVVGLVFLAGAYTSRTLKSPRELCADGLGSWAHLDTDGDQALGDAELGPDRGPAGVSVTDTLRGLDYDEDGVVRAWELAAAGRCPGDAMDSDTTELRPGVPWPSDVVRDRRLPTLAIYGGLDQMSVHGPWLEKLAERHDLTGLQVEYRAALGHQLSRQEGERFGPIDPGVVEHVAEWCSALAGRSTP